MERRELDETATNPTRPVRDQIAEVVADASEIDRIDRVLFEHARDDINPARGQYGCDCADEPGVPLMTSDEHRRHVAEQIAAGRPTRGGL